MFCQSFRAEVPSAAVAPRSVWVINRARRVSKASFRRKVRRPYHIMARKYFLSVSDWV